MESTIDICQEPEGEVCISIARWNSDGILEKIEHYWRPTYSSYKRCQRLQEKFMKGVENETS